MVPLTALVIPTFVLFSQPQPDRHDLGGDPAVAAQPVRRLPDAGLRRRRRARRAARRRPRRRRGRVPTFLQVALPLLRPAVVTVLLLSIVGTWNNYFLPLAMLANTKLFPITVGLGLWEGQASAQQRRRHTRCGA